MSHIFLCLILVYLSGSGLCLSEDDSWCISKYNKTLSNDFLIGTWYEVYGIAEWVIAKPSPFCKRQVITKMSADRLDLLTYLYRILNMPELENPVYIRDNYNITYGVLSGSKEGKIFFRDPKHVTWRRDNTDGRIYKYINDNLMLYQLCGNFANRWYLLSKTRNLDHEQVKVILDNISEVNHLRRRKLCTKVDD